MERRVARYARRRALACPGAERRARAARRARRPRLGYCSERNEDENIRLSVEKVNASPVVAKFVKEGKVKVIGAYYDLNTGKVTPVE